MRILVAALVLTLLPVITAADDLDRRRARFNYMLYCQGCHTPDGRGIDTVPQIKDHVGYFLQTPEGRDYLVRVPGAAGSVLDNAKLAEVLNWMILEFGGDSIPDDFKPYTAAEIANLRDKPLQEVVEYRRELVKQLARSEEQGVSSKQ